MVAATSASCSGVVSTLPCPIALEPTARSSPISAAAGIVDGAAPASPGSSLKPKRSAAATSRFAPSSAPSGAKTELHECAKLLRSVPPQNSPLAFWISTPSISVRSWIANFAERLTTLASSAAASVMILNVLPGGCGADWAIPASASTSPLLGRTTAIPP